MSGDNDGLAPPPDRPRQATDNPDVRTLRRHRRRHARLPAEPSLDELPLFGLPVGCLTPPSFRPEAWIGRSPLSPQDLHEAADRYARTHFGAVGLRCRGPLAWAAYWAIASHGAVAEIASRLGESGGPAHDSTLRAGPPLIIPRSSGAAYHEP